MKKGQVYTDGVITGVLLNTYPSANGKDIAILQLEDGTKVKVLSVDLVEFTEDVKEGVMVVTMDEIRRALVKVQKDFMTSEFFNETDIIVTIVIFAGICAELGEALDVNSEEDVFTKEELKIACKKVADNLAEKTGDDFADVMHGISLELERYLFSNAETL